MCTHTYVPTCTHIHTYIHRERDRGAETQTGRGICAFKEGFREGRKLRMLTHRLEE